MHARPPPPARPDAAALAAAAGRRVPDVIGPGLRVLFCGINPGLYSAATGHHFARPGNRFWKALHASGFTPRRLDPTEEGTLLAYGLGITNLVARATASAAELTDAELLAGRRRLAALAARRAPRFVAVLGLGAYRVAFGVRDAAVGPRPERLGSAHVWLLPNPSGLNAHHQLADLTAAFGALRRAASRAPRVARARSREACGSRPGSAPATRRRTRPARIR